MLLRVELDTTLLARRYGSSDSNRLGVERSMRSAHEFHDSIGHSSFSTALAMEQER